MAVVIRSEARRSWLVELESASVTQLTVDWAINLIIESGAVRWTVRIESPFVVHMDDNEQLVVPEDPATAAPVLQVLRRSVSQIEAADDGHLVVLFGDEGRIEVPAAEDYEPWEIADGEGRKIVSVPGGELAVWSETAGDQPA